MVNFQFKLGFRKFFPNIQQFCFRFLIIIQHPKIRSKLKKNIKDRIKKKYFFLNKFLYLIYFISCRSVRINKLSHFFIFLKKNFIFLLFIFRLLLILGTILHFSNFLFIVVYVFSYFFYSFFVICYN
jgi:hypothetical protein